MRSGIIAWGSTIVALSLALAPLVKPLPVQYQMAASLAGLPVYYLTRPLRRRHIEDLILHEERIEFALERKIIEERNIYLPHLSPQRSTASGEAKAILDALEAKAHIAVNFLGKTRTYNHETYHFDLLDYNDRSDILAARTFIKIAVAARGSPFFEFNRGVLSVQLPLPQRDRTFPGVSNPAWLGNSRQQILFPVGVNSDSTLEVIPVDQGFSHVLITGSTRSGKSLAAQSAIQFLARRHTPFEFGFSIIEVKNSPTFRPAEWERYPHCVTQVANTHEAGIGVLLWYLAESYRRGEALQQMQCDTLDQFNRSAPQPMPHLFCLIDEALSYLDPNTAPPLYRSLFIAIASELAVKSAAVGIHLVHLVQRAGASEGDPFYHATTLRSNIGAIRICFKVQTPQDGMIALNISEDEAQHEPLAGEAAHLLGFGDGIYRSAETAELIRFQALTPDDPASDPPFNSGGIEIGADAEWEPLPAITQEVIDRFCPKAVRKSLPDSAERKAESSSGLSGEQQRAVYTHYRALREGSKTGKPVSMSKALQTIGGFGSDGGEALQHWRTIVRESVKAHLREWVSELPAELTPAQIVDRVWSMKAGDKDVWLKLVEQIKGAQP